MSSHSVNHCSAIPVPSPQHLTRSVYDIITARIVEELERGVVPWRRPWGCAG